MPTASRATMMMYCHHTVVTSPGCSPGGCPAERAPNPCLARHQKWRPRRHETAARWPTPSACWASFTARSALIAAPAARAAIKGRRGRGVRHAHPALVRRRRTAARRTARPVRAAGRVRAPPRPPPRQAATSVAAAGRRTGGPQPRSGPSRAVTAWLHAGHLGARLAAMVSSSGRDEYANPEDEYADDEYADHDAEDREQPSVPGEIPDDEPEDDVLEQRQEVPYPGDDQ